MEEGETVSMLSRKELRKQKLMEYLATKGKQKLPNPKAYLRVDALVKKPVTALTTSAVQGKENKDPPQRLNYDITKVKPLAAQSTTCPLRKAFGVTNNMNVKMSILEKKKKETCLTARGPAQKNHNSVLRSTYTVISSRSHLSAGTDVKNQPNTVKSSTNKISSNLCPSAVLSSNRFTSRSTAVLPVPVITVSDRMSLGPLVKTKTGLIPAVTLPRNTNSHLKHTSATAPNNMAIINNPISKKAISRPLTTSSRAINNPDNERTILSLTSRFRKVEIQSKVNIKQPLVKQSQPTCKTQILSGLKPASLSSRGKKTTEREPDRKAGMSKNNQPAGKHADRPTKQRSSNFGENKDKMYKVTSQTSCRSRAVSGASVNVLADKTMKYETESKTGHSSTNSLSQQTAIKKTSVPVKTRTRLQPTKTISLTGKPTDLKTPKVTVFVPQTGGKKLTAAQEERMKKLKEWREAKGISYKRPPMPVKPQVRRTVAVPELFWTAMRGEDEAHSLIEAVDRSLADCIKLLGEGCPPKQVNEVLARLPAVSHKFAKYWICQARLMEQEGNLNVLPMFEEAVRVVLEPVDELRSVVFEILKKKDEIQVSEEKEKDEHQMPACDSTNDSCNNQMMTPKPVRALISGERGDSSVIKYKITATPGGPSSQQRKPVQVDGQEVRFFTPVRRSVRIERASFQYPSSLQDHDLCVASYNDLMSKEGIEECQEQDVGEPSPCHSDTPMYIYRQNEALKDKVFVKLVYDKVM